MKIEQLFSMDGYTFDEGIAFLVLVKAPLGVIKHLQKTHNRNHMHSEIHKMLRLPRTKDILRKETQPRAVALPPLRGGAAFPLLRGQGDSAGESLVSTKSRKHEIPKKTNEIEPKSNENPSVESTSARKDEIPKEETPSPSERGCRIPPSKGVGGLAGESDIILTEDDVRTHKYTRLDQMPNDLTRQLFLKKDELYHEMQQFHLKMRNVPEGEEHNEERADYRANILRLDTEIDEYWKQIDAEIERFETEKERADKKADEAPAFDVSTYRAYISKALRKKKLTPAQLAELQHRVDAMLAAYVELKPETLAKLKSIGISVDRT